MSEDIVKESIKCLANMEIKETTYQVARSVVLDEIERLNNIINELERRFNQELENNEKWDVEDTKQFYSKKWYKDILNDFKNMIKN